MKGLHGVWDGFLKDRAVLKLFLFLGQLLEQQLGVRRQ